MTAIPVLELDHVSRHYEGGGTIVKALDDVSVRISPAELVGIIGPSGSGKSTMLLIAGLLEPPTAGTVRIGGQEVSHPDADLEMLRDFRRRRIGFVFQKANLIPFLNATENVALALEIDDVAPGLARKYAGRLLDAVDLGHRRDSFPGKLSGGEQQRVAIARALANNPNLLLADEPTAALDALRARQVIALFRQVAEIRGSAVAIVTHDHRTLDHVDRVIELTDGHITSM